MIIWRGWGIIFFIIMFPVWGVLELITNFNSPDSEMVTSSIAIFIAGIISSRIGFKVNAKYEGTKYEDNPPHLLIMIPLQHGGILMSIIGIIVFFSNY